LPDDHPDTGAGEVNTAFGEDFPLLDQVAQGVADHDDGVERFPPGEARGHGLRSVTHARSPSNGQRVAGFLLIQRCQRLVSRREAARAADVQLIRADARRQQQQATQSAE
jgi:hypothetical protein